MKRLLTLLVMAALTFAAYPAMASVNGSPHDFAGVAGAGSDTGTRGLCETCHVPHAASSTTAKRLWRTNVNMVADSGPWNTSVTGLLCGTCHYSGVGIITYKNAAGNSPHFVDLSVYAAASHGRTVATLTAAHTAGSDQNIGDKVGDTGRPYMNQTYMQCTSCHNPHDDATVRPFLRAMANENTISKVCGGCHDRYSTAVGTNNTGPTNTSTGASFGVSASMHPVDKTFADDAANNTDTTDSGAATQFHEPIAATTVNVAPYNSQYVGTGIKNIVGAGYWILGGKFQTSAGAPHTASYTVAGSTDQIGCQTCHSIHAPASTADGSKALYLLAEDNSPAAAGAGAGLCEDCHGGGWNGSDLGNSSKTNQYVGGATTYTTSNNQTLRDHPIDAATDGTPKLEGWGSTLRYERNPGGVKAWPFVAGSYTPTNTTNLGGTGIGRIVCTSCHSAHNAKPGTSLNRTGGDATQFCFSCHLSQDMVPGNHHSTVFSLSPSPVGGNWASSKIACANCHQASSGITTAHMGFFNLNNALISSTKGNADSELCNSCHTNTQLTEDPVYAAGTFGTPGMPAPNGHLSDLGQGAAARSHYLGTFVNAANSINVKTGAWMAAVNNGRGTSYSKYGNTAATWTDTHNKLAPTVNTDGSSQVVCESCHAVLYNCGDGSLQGGWEVNLLLQNYEDNKQAATDGSIIGTSVQADDGKGGTVTTPYTYNASGTSAVGSGFCVACHNQNNNANGTGSSAGFVGHSIVTNPAIPPANMHPMTGWTITRAVDAGRATQTLITGAGSYADQVSPAAAPNKGSYDGVNMMSCDGCHRPHRADQYAAWKPGYKANSVSVILEAAGPANGDYGTLCQQCHNM